MLDVHKLNQIKLRKQIFLRNKLLTPGMEEFKELFGELFGDFKRNVYNGDFYFESNNGIIFARYRTALEKARSLGLKTEIVLKDEVWRFKYNGRWFLMSEYFEFLPEDVLIRAKKILKGSNQLYFRWPFDNQKDYIIVTNSKYALMIPPSNIQIIKGVKL